MGGRGAFDPNYGRTGGIPEDKREYSCVGFLSHIKIIQCDTKVNNPTTSYSNTANTTYYSYSEKFHRIDHIYYFRNHKLCKSVDFKPGEEPHTHYWGRIAGPVGRKKHDKKNIFPLNNRDLRLMKKAMEYNRLKQIEYEKKHNHS